MLLFDALVDILYQENMSSFRRLDLTGENGKGVERKPETKVCIFSGSMRMMDCSVRLLLQLHGDAMDTSRSRSEKEIAEWIAASSVAF